MVDKPTPEDAKPTSPPQTEKPVDPAAQEEAARDHEGGGYA